MEPDEKSVLQKTFPRKKEKNGTENVFPKSSFWHHPNVKWGIIVHFEIFLTEDQVEDLVNNSTSAESSTDENDDDQQAKKRAWNGTSQTQTTVCGRSTMLL